MNVMKLNKQERFTAYCIMLAEAEDIDSNVGYGLCHLIFELFALVNKTGDARFNLVIKYYFPELESKNPNREYLSNYWFDTDISGWQKRIELLKQCIEETA